VPLHGQGKRLNKKKQRERSVLFNNTLNC